MSEPLKSYPAMISAEGVVTLRHPLKLDSDRMAIVTIVSGDSDETLDTALLSEDALAHDWNKPDEEKAWAYLQEEK